VHFGWNARLLRVLFVIGLLFSGFFPVGLIYCLLWYLMEEAPGRPGERSDTVSARTGMASTSATAGDVKMRFARLEERLRNIEESVTSHDYDLRRELRKLEN
jgi:phage shock protein C